MDGVFDSLCVVLQIAVLLGKYAEVCESGGIIFTDIGVSGKAQGGIGAFILRIIDSHVDASSVLIDHLIGVSLTVSLVKESVSPVHYQPKQRPEQSVVLQICPSETDVSEGGKLPAQSG